MRIELLKKVSKNIKLFSYGLFKRILCRWLNAANYWKSHIRKVIWLTVLSNLSSSVINKADEVSLKYYLQNANGILLKYHLHKANEISLNKYFQIRKYFVLLKKIKMDWNEPNLKFYIGHIPVISDKLLGSERKNC